MPRISVITIVRNGLPFIEETVKSVLDQDYGNLEYIVVDGGSTDGTVEVIKSHAAGIAKWISEPDRGISDAFNKGLALSTGDYVLFLNADDMLANPGVLREVANRIAENHFPEMLYGDCDVLERDSGEVLYRASIPFSPEELKQGKIIPHPSLFTSRAYFDRYGRFDEAFKIAMDYEWMLRGIFDVRVAHEAFLVTNVRNGGISTINQKRVVEEILAALRKNHYIRSGLDELKLRSYFSGRAFAKSFLRRVGLYDAFSSFRNRRQ